MCVAVRLATLVVDVMWTSMSVLATRVVMEEHAAIWLVGSAASVPTITLAPLVKLHRAVSLNFICVCESILFILLPVVCHSCHVAQV